MSPATRERLSLDDAQILRLESPVIKGHTGKVLILAPDSAGEPLSVPRLRERVSERMDGFPRLSQKVAEPRLRLGRPAWVDADEIDLTWHVAEPGHADPLSDEELRAAIGELLSERLDHTRPLWRLDVLPLTGGRAAIVGRIHHAMADGVSAIKLTAGLLWDSRRRNAQPPCRRADEGPRKGDACQAHARRRGRRGADPRPAPVRALARASARP